MAATMAVPAAADTLPAARSFQVTTSERARANPDAAKAADEVARADAQEAACTAGDAAACSALGEAYARGQGRPQNRPVAEILFREACEGGVAQACFRRGDLLLWQGADRNLEEVAALFTRACAGGALDGCDAKADLIGSSDPAAAEALRRSTCAAGRSNTCLRLARDLTGTTRSPSEQDEGAALIERLCRGGMTDACRDGMFGAQRTENGAGPRTRAFQDLGCTAGDAFPCTELAMAALRGEWAGGTGADARSRALSYYDRACSLGSYHCETAQDLRALPELTARCESTQDAAACERLGQLHARRGGPFEDLPRALALLGPACERAADPAAIANLCSIAGTIALDLTPTAGGDPARADRYLTRACEAGDDGACSTLADALGEGDRLPADRPRALALIAAQCDKGYPSDCRYLEEQIAEDPATPLVEADSDYAADMSDPETIARLAAENAERNRQAEAFRAAQCTKTSVVFRGTTYQDELCDNVGGVINGFALKPGAAPWQALLWRPPVLGRVALTEAQRVLCGGAVIRTGWVLTAAHCLTDEGNVKIATGGHRIRLGLANPLANEGLTYPIVNAFPHPLFDRKTFAFDIALVQYDPGKGTKGEVVYPVARIRPDPTPFTVRTITAGLPAYVYGWGRTALEGGEAPDRLRGARLALQSQRACTELTKFRDVRVGSVLCAAGTRGEQACFGDSGGPLITYGDADKVPTLIGVVSAGRKCGRTGEPSRYTRVAHPEVQKWLNTMLNPPGGARAR
jgi:TPR repeat protein